MFATRPPPVRLRYLFVTHSPYTLTETWRGALTVFRPQADRCPLSGPLSDIEDAVRQRLAADPWATNGMLTPVSIERWTIPTCSPRRADRDGPNAQRRDNAARPAPGTRAVGERRRS